MFLLGFYQCKLYRSLLKRVHFSITATNVKPQFKLQKNPFEQLKQNKKRSTHNQKSIELEFLSSKIYQK